jgi:hypothetical protein
MTTYLLNAFSTTMLPEGGVVEFENLAAPPMLGTFVSAVGHEGTAMVFSDILGVKVEPARVMVTLQPGDVAIVGQIANFFLMNSRLPEGKVLSAEELRDFPIRWVRVTVREPVGQYHCQTCANSFGELCQPRVRGKAHTSKVTRWNA